MNASSSRNVRLTRLYLVLRKRREKCHVAIGFAVEFGLSLESARYYVERARRLSVRMAAVNAAIDCEYQRMTS